MTMFIHSLHLHQHKKNDVWHVSWSFTVLTNRFCWVKPFSNILKASKSELTLDSWPIERIDRAEPFHLKHDMQVTDSCEAEPSKQTSWIVQSIRTLLYHSPQEEIRRKTHGLRHYYKRSIVKSDYKPPVMLPEIISGGFFMSTSPCGMKTSWKSIQTETKSHIFIHVERLTAMTKPQLATGPQKWVVFGPTGLFKNALKDAMKEQATRLPWIVHNTLSDWTQSNT